MYQAIYSRLSFRNIQKDTYLCLLHSMYCIALFRTRFLVYSQKILIKDTIYGVQSLSEILYLNLLTPFISQDSYATLF